MPRNSFALRVTLITAALATALGGGYVIGVRQENTEAMATVSRLSTFAHLPGHRKEIDMLVLLATMDTDEFLAKRREMLCKIVKIKAGLVADMYRAHIKIDRVSPPRADLANVSRTIAYEAEAAEKAFKASICSLE